MLQTITSQWQNNKPSREQILKTTQQHRDQMRQGLQSLGAKLQQGSQDLMARDETQRIKEQFQSVVGNKLSNLKFSKFTEGVSNQGGFNDQLAMFNERMKEEAMRRDVRREAEEACLQTMRDHLSEFLQQHSDGTYEEWIFALHPENTQDASLLQDMEYKEVDLRFYVEESDHRQLWNETINDPHRQVAARTSMWGGTILHEEQPTVDLLGAETPSKSQTATEDVFQQTNIVLDVSIANGVPYSHEEVDLISF